jgi:hypothetical protein
MRLNFYIRLNFEIISNSFNADSQNLNKSCILALTLCYVNKPSRVFLDPYRFCQRRPLVYHRLVCLSVRPPVCHSTPRFPDFSLHWMKKFEIYYVAFPLNVKFVFRLPWPTFDELCPHCLWTAGWGLCIACKYTLNACYVVKQTDEMLIFAKSLNFQRTYFA